MMYLPFILFGVLFLVLLITSSRKKNARKKLEQLRNEWGYPKSDDYQFDKIDKYYNVSKNPFFHKLSMQTLSDIDFYELFQFVDRTTSKVGQQFLFDRLLKPSNAIEDLANLSQKAQFFKENTLLREEVQLLLSSLNNHDAYYIAYLLEGNLLKRPKWFTLLYADTAVAITLIILSFFFPVMIIGVMLLFAFNLFLHYWNKNNMFLFSRSLPQLDLLITTAGELKRKDLPFESMRAEQSILSLKAFQKKLKLIGFGGAGIKDELAQALYYFIDLIKAFTLIELYALYNIIRELEHKQADIDTLIRYVGLIDTSLSIASLRAGSVSTCEPTFLEPAKQLEASNVYHPLIENCVANSISVANKGVLITGSNMSGKSTFLRTVAINSVLAQTIYTCFADSFHTPIIKLSSSIRIDDSLLDGKSYYFEEVSVIASLVKMADEAHQNLFILDEVFKGTNTIERIAAAKAILSYLNKNNNITFVSTHDIELSEMLKEAYSLYHFEEIIRDDQLHFDHTIKKGPLTSRNAIRILEISNYPALITEEAREISQRLTMVTTNLLP